MARDSDTNQPRSRWRQSRVPPPPIRPELVRLASEEKSQKSKPKSSRLSLFNLFSSPNVEKARGHYEPGLAAPIRPSSPPPPASISRQPSQRSVATQPTTTTVADAQASKGKIQKLNGSVRAPKQPNWSPPPLFQAFPQAIKHVKVDYSVTSTEAVLKSQQQHQRRTSNVLNSIGKNATERASSPSMGAGVPKANSKRLSTIGTIQTAERIGKIFVLTTSGHVVQYAGEGPSDRMPEKVLQLGAESAAFPSDSILGKHWVLQISQTASDDGTIAAGQKSLLSRLRLQNSSSRRQTSNLLLVLESAEDMESWLSEVRTQIAMLGGKDYRAEVDPRASTQSPELEREPSHRFQAQRKSEQNSERSRIDSASVLSDGIDFTAASETESARSSRRPSAQHSVDLSSPSPATTPVSAAAAQLNHLREGSRLSMLSVATSNSTVTDGTEHDSSPEISPILETFFKFKDAETSRDPTSLKSFAMNPNPTAAHWRRSMQITLPPMTESPALNEDAAEHPNDGRVLVRPPSATFNRPSRVRGSLSPEKRSVLRSSSAPAPTIPLPPLPTEGQTRERSHRPVSTLHGLIAGPPSRPPTIPLPAPPPGAKPGKAVNFSRRQASKRDSSLPASLQQRIVEQPASISIVKEMTTPPPQVRLPSPVVTPQAESSSPISPLEKVEEEPALSDAQISPKTPVITIDEPSEPKPALPHRKRPSLNLPSTETTQTVLGADSTNTNTSTGAASRAPKTSEPPIALQLPMNGGYPFISRRYSGGRPPPIPITVKPSLPQPQTHNQPHTPTLHRPVSLQVSSDRTPFLSNVRAMRRASYNSNPGPPPTVALNNLFSAPKTQSGYFRDTVLTQPLRAPSPSPAIIPRGGRTTPTFANGPTGPPPSIPLPAPPKSIIV